MFQLREDLHFPRHVLQGAPLRALVFMYVLHGVHVAGAVTFLHDADLKARIHVEIVFYAPESCPTAPELVDRAGWFERRISKLDIVEIFNFSFFFYTRRDKMREIVFRSSL